MVAVIGLLTFKSLYLKFNHADFFIRLFQVLGK